MNWKCLVIRFVFLFYRDWPHSWTEWNWRLWGIALIYFWKSISKWYTDFNKIKLIFCRNLQVYECIVSIYTYIHMYAHTTFIFSSISPYITLEIPPYLHSYLELEMHGELKEITVYAEIFLKIAHQITLMSEWIQ